MFMQVLAVGRCSSPEPEEWMQNLGYSSCREEWSRGSAAGLVVCITTYIALSAVVGAVLKLMHALKYSLKYQIRELCNQCNMA